MRLANFGLAFCYRPSPLGRVPPEGGGRGAVKCCVFTNILANTYCLHTSSVTAYGRATFPKGEGLFAR